MNKVTILGSGTPLSSFYQPFDFRNTSATLLQTANKNILLDCGEGVRGSLDKIKFDYYDLDAIFISHFHQDHFTVETLLSTIVLRARREKQVKKIEIYGPKRIKERLSAIVDLKHAPNTFEEKFVKYLDLSFHEYEDKVPLQVSDTISMTPFKVTHGIMDAYAMRFQLDKKIFTYSGDSGVCDSLIASAKDADTFLCEATIGVNDEIMSEKHLTSYQVGEIAQKANVKHLILTHIRGNDSDEVMKKEVKRAGFLGTIDIAYDLSNFSL